MNGLSAVGPFAGGVPGGQGEGEEEVVVFAVAGGHGGGAVGLGAGLEAEKFAAELWRGGFGVGDEEAVELEEQVQAGEDIGAGDVGASGGPGDGASGGDDDGYEADAALGVAELFADKIDDGFADAGRVDDEGGAAVEIGMAEDGGDVPGEGGVGSAEREALEGADVESPGMGASHGDRIAGAEGVDALDQGERGRIVVFSDVEAENERPLWNGREAAAVF